MSRGTRRRLAAIGGAVVLAASLAGGAGAHPFSGWTGKSDPFRWQAETLSCGSGDGELNRMRAHSRWLTSPANGYQKVTFWRQIQDETTSEWTSVQRDSRSTKNTPFEGAQTVLHWSQFFTVREEEAGMTSRDVVRFAWKRDRAGDDLKVFSRTVALPPCVVGT